MGEQAGTLSVFCGYAHEDKTLFEQLKTALAALLRGPENWKDLHDIFHTIHW